MGHQLYGIPPQVHSLPLGHLSSDVPASQIFQICNKGCDQYCWGLREILVPRVNGTAIFSANPDTLLLLCVMDGFPSTVVTLLSLGVTSIACVYLYKHRLLPEILNPESDFWIFLLGTCLIISFSPLVDYVGDLLGIENSVHSLGPS